MPRRARTTILGNIGRGYARLLLSSVKALAFLTILLAVSAALTYPLWFLATEHVTIYTWLIIAVIAAALLFIAVKRIRGAVLRERDLRAFFRSSLLPPVFTVVKSAVVLVSLYGLVILFLGRYPVIAVVLTPVYLIGVGFLFYGRKDRKDWNG